MKPVGLAAMLFAAGCSAQAHKPAYDGWSLLAPLPVPNSETGVAELDGKIYVIGGYPSDPQNGRDRPDVWKANNEMWPCGT